MKKLFLSILVLGLLLSGCATAPTANVQSTLIKQGNIKIGMSYDNLLQVLGGSGAIVENYPLFNDKNFKHMIASPNFWNGYIYDTKFYEFENENPPEWSNWNGISDLEGYRLIKIWDDYLPMIDHFVKLSKSNEATNGLVQLKSSALKHYASTGKSTTTFNPTADINFTIDDKKDQCETIGFEPATEKFADCVLRLVELDVKSQQANQIALAQSQGNQQVVTQLQNQQNDQSSQAFIDLGLKLLSPQSTASSPSTSSCTVIGSGAYKTVNCW